MSLTRRQSEILNFITEHCTQHGYAPTLQEIGNHFQLSSVATVHKHVSQLVEKGHLRRGRNQGRGLELVTTEGERTCNVPLLGAVAAGVPIEAVADNEEIALPETWLWPEFC